MIRVSIGSVGLGSLGVSDTREKKFVNVLAVNRVVVYSRDIKREEVTKMATNYTTLKLTDNEILALSKWLRIAQHSEAEILDYDPADKDATRRLKALDSIDRKIEKEGWE